VAESHDGIIVAVAWTTPDVVVSAFEAAAVETFVWSACDQTGESGGELDWFT